MVYSAGGSVASHSSLCLLAAVVLAALGDAVPRPRIEPPLFVVDLSRDSTITHDVPVAKDARSQAFLGNPA
jgi:hypothetical protein